MTLPSSPENDKATFKLEYVAADCSDQDMAMMRQDEEMYGGVQESDRATNMIFLSGTGYASESRLAFYGNSDSKLPLPAYATRISWLGFSQSSPVLTHWKHNTRQMIQNCKHLECAVVNF